MRRISFILNCKTTSIAYLLIPFLSYWATSTQESDKTHICSPRVVGRYTYHLATNDNDRRLVDLCEFNNLQPARLKRPQPIKRQWAWEHTEGNKSQLDHILIRGKWINSLQSCRAYSSVDLDSDHRMVTAKLKLSFRVTSSQKSRQDNFDFSLLTQNSNLQYQFEVEVSN